MKKNNYVRQNSQICGNNETFGIKEKRSTISKGCDLGGGLGGIGVLHDTNIYFFQFQVTDNNCKLI